MTLQDLADAIHKSRATVCKYENGDISVDIETLYEISQILQVSISVQRMASSIFMKKKANLENTKQP